MATANALSVTLETPAGPLEIPAIESSVASAPCRRAISSKVPVLHFRTRSREAIPELSRQYESNVKGLYIVGSLAGYPLIKQAMNQGHDVVEFIHGNDIRPADHPLLQYQFHGLPFERDVDELMELFQKRIPMFRQLNSLTFRELIIESTLTASYPSGPTMDEALEKMRALRTTLGARQPAPRATKIIREGDEIYHAGAFGTSFFTIVAGEVMLEIPGAPPRITQLSQGQFFGEMSLLSGRPRLETAKAGANCILVETPRRTMLKLMNSNDEVRQGIDWIFVVRELQRQFAPYAKVSDLREIASRTLLRQYKADEVVFTEGDRGDSLHVIRSGGVGLSRRSNKGAVLVAQVRSGQPIGEMALMGDPVRRETATALVALETIEVKRPEFLALVELGGRTSSICSRTRADASSTTPSWKCDPKPARSWTS